MAWPKKALISPLGPFLFRFAAGAMVVPFQWPAFSHLYQRPGKERFIRSAPL